MTDINQKAEDELRRQTIGGSCALRIMEGDWHKLWLDKMGYRERDDLSDVLPVQLGIWTEPFNIGLFRKDMGVEVQEQVRYHYKWGAVPCRGTLDGEFWYHGERIGLEVKHTFEMNTMRKQLERYMPQLQLYMQVAALDYMYFANLFGNRRYEYVKVAKDQNYLNTMYVHLKEFWGYVEREEEPPQSTPHITTGIDQIAIDDMVARDARQDNEFMHQAHEYVSTMQAAKEHESAKKQLKAMVATNEREVYSDVVTLKRAKNGSLRINVNKEYTDE